MSAIFRCDGCGRVAIGDFDGCYWQPPPTWRSRAFDDFEVHGCSVACIDKVMERGSATPTGGYEEAGFDVRPFKKTREPPPINGPPPLAPILPWPDATPPAA